MKTAASIAIATQSVIGFRLRSRRSDYSEVRTASTVKVKSTFMTFMSKPFFRLL